MKETDTHVSSSLAVAVYKGQKVAVNMVDKTEISLTRQDLIELINVSSLLFVLFRLIIAFPRRHQSNTLHVSRKIVKTKLFLRQLSHTRVNCGHSFVIMVINNGCINLLKQLPPDFTCVITLPCC